MLASARRDRAGVGSASVTERGCVPRKLYLQKRAVGWPAGPGQTPGSLDLSCRRSLPGGRVHRRYQAGERRSGWGASGSGSPLLAQAVVRVRRTVAGFSTTAFAHLWLIFVHFFFSVVHNFHYIFPAGSCWEACLFLSDLSDVCPSPCASDCWVDSAVWYRPKGFPVMTGTFQSHAVRRSLPVAAEPSKFSCRDGGIES